MTFLKLKINFSKAISANNFLSPKFLKCVFRNKKSKFVKKSIDFLENYDITKKQNVKEYISLFIVNIKRSVHIHNTAKWVKKAYLVRHKFICANNLNFVLGNEKLVGLLTQPQNFKL